MSDPQEAATPHPIIGEQTMTYVGDFPPCSHRFINSNGVILCQFCGAVSKADRPTRTDTSTIRLRP